MFRPLFVAAGAALVFGLAACGQADSAADDPGQAGDAPVAGVCHQDHPDCVDTVVGEPDDLPGEPHGDFDADAARAEARALLGSAEADLDAQVRIGRRGDEQFALTEDYVIGRMTVELDVDAEGTYRVTAVTVELPEGPETFEQE